MQQVARWLFGFMLLINMGASATTRTAAPNPLPTTGTPQVLAEVAGDAITAEEITKGLGQPLSRLEQQVYEMKRMKLDTLIGERLLALEAARHNLSILALLDAAVTSKVALVTEAEIAAFYQAHKDRLKGEEAARHIRQPIQGRDIAPMQIL